MGGYISHPEIEGVLKRFAATGPIYDVGNFERELIHMAYMRLRWQFLLSMLHPSSVDELERDVDNLIHADAERVRSQGDAA
jgi:hypothetical protein